MDKYLERYNKLISHYKNKITEGYVEKHHIIPKCLGGTNELSNLVALSPRAHFIAHYLLHRAYPENVKLAQAFGMMVVNNPKQNRVCSSRMYGLARTARSSSLKGKKRPEWVKEKLKVPKGATENYKKPKTAEHAEKISKALIGRPKKKFQCPHCKVEASAANLKKWHLDKCKLK